MSEAAPGISDNPIFATPERAELAQAIRELIETAMTTPEATENELLKTANAIRRTTEALLHKPAGTQTIGYTPRSHGDYLPRSPVVGDASPMSPRLDWEIIDGKCFASGIYTAAYEGPPGYVHGGMIALAFDEVLGIVNIANGSPGMTGSLSIRYRNPTPLYREVQLVAWVDRIEGRRIQSRAELRVDDQVCAEASGLFIQPRPELAAKYFGRTTDETT